MILLVFIFFLPKQILSETVHGCTIHNNQNQQQTISSNRTFIILSCPNDGYILVENLTFGVHKTSNSTCTYQSDDCITRTTFIGMECNGLNNCKVDLNPQYLHICSQYSDYMVLDYLCLQAESLSICDNRLLTTSIQQNDQYHLLLRSPNYPNEYDNSLNCSCRIQGTRSTIEFLDFYLEERDEMNFCTRDVLQIGNRSFCDSTIDQTKIDWNSSIDLIFKTNDVLTRKGLWLLIQSHQQMQISCRNSFDLPFLTSTLLTTTINLPIKRRFTLSFILILSCIFVIILLLLNLLLIILCWKQKLSKHQRFFCSKRSSSSYSSSSITFGETPVLNSLDTQKQQTISTTTGGVYEDPNELLTLQRKLDLNRSFYSQQRFCPIVLPSCPTTTGYNPMIHCHFNTSAQTFYSSDAQHIYETIPDGQCPYQRLAVTLRRQQQQLQCTCYCTQKPLTTNENITTEINPETLV